MTFTTDQKDAIVAAALAYADIWLTVDRNTTLCDELVALRKACHPKPVAREVRVQWANHDNREGMFFYSVIEEPHRPDHKITRVLVDGEQVWPKL
jgi:hypothetical protein